MMKPFSSLCSSSVPHHLRSSALSSSSSSSSSRGPIVPPFPWLPPGNHFPPTDAATFGNWFLDSKLDALRFDRRFVNSLKVNDPYSGPIDYHVDLPLSGGRMPSTAAEHLGKLRQFLTTLRRFGCDLSPSIGERVEALIRALVESEISVEEFLDQLLRVAHFPLKPTIVPFLKTGVPILQQQVSRLAEFSRMTMSEYLRLKKEEVLFKGIDECHSDEGQSVHCSMTSSHPRSDNSHSLGKRHSNEDDEVKDLKSPTNITKRSAKRVRFHDRFRNLSQSMDDVTNIGCSAERTDVEPEPNEDKRSDRNPPGLGDEHKNAVRLITQQLEKERIFQRKQSKINHSSDGSSRLMKTSFGVSADDWNYVENTLQNIVNLVEQCQQTMNVLQERSHRSSKPFQSKKSFKDITLSAPSAALAFPNSSLSTDLRSSPIWSPREEVQQSKDLDGDSQHSQERPQKLTDGTLVGDMKRCAMMELQKAIAAAEVNALRILDSDRLQLETTMEDIREQTRLDVRKLLTKQFEHCDEKCWNNCGNLAKETCSGCREAKYCGIVCQHRHWDVHKNNCAESNNAPAIDENCDPQHSSSSEISDPTPDKKILLPSSPNAPDDCEDRVKTVTQSDDKADVGPTADVEGTLQSAQ